MLYTSPNTTFIATPSGDHAVTVNDTSGSIATLQSAINSTRASNPTNIIVITLLSNATYVVSSASLVLDSGECLVAGSATIQAANSSVTVPLVQINSGATNVSIAGGVFDGNGANINALYAPAASHVNVDKIIARNCGQDCILLNGRGNTTYDNEMTVTRCDVSGSPAHAGISIHNSTQTAVLDNNCHNNSIGIYLSCAWAEVANNTCESNSIGIQIAGGNDNVVANNTCNNNGTGISAAASNNMIVSSSLGNNSTAGINSTGSGNNFLNNLFSGGNAVNFTSGGSGNNIIAYKTNLSASGQNYFYPPLIDNQHTDPTIVNGMGRVDLTIGSTSIDSVQSQYNSAMAGNPNDVIVLHLNGTFTVGATPLTLQSDTCVLLNGTIQINASTTAAAAIQAGTSPRQVSISGGTIDAGNNTGKTGISLPVGGMIQVDSMTLQNFGSNVSAISGSDAIHFPNGGSTPYMVTRCYINGSAGRAIWSQLNAQKALYCDNICLNTRAGIDCDSSTYGAVCMFNNCSSNLYGIWYEQSASHNTSIGNICNNNSRYDLDTGNNAHTTPTEYNSYICNTGMGHTGLTSGAVGTNTFTSHNFNFNNVIVNASITSNQAGTNNYYCQNYLAGGSLTTSGAEMFFNSSDVSSNLFFQDSNSGLILLAQNAATTNGTPIVLGSPSGLGNDQWALVPTDTGYYRIVNKKSQSVMAVQGASLSPGAPVVQFTFGSSQNDQWMPMSAGNGLYYFVNRNSGLCLDVPGSASGTQLDQQPYAGTANQQFNLLLNAPGAVMQSPFLLSVSPGSQTILAGQSNSFTITITTNSSFTGSVNLSVSGLPANTTSNFNPASLSSSGTSTLTISPATNAPVGTYSLAITAIGSGITNTALVSLTINSLTTASPGTLLWTAASGSDINWSTAQNWTNTTSGSYGPPGISNDVVLGNVATVVTSNSVDNVENTSPTINSLTFNNTNGFHTTQIAGGATLTIAGGKGMTVGTESDLGIGTIVYDTITGGGTLAVSNASANVLIRQYTAGSSTGDIQRGTLDLSGLNNFTMTGNGVEVGTASTTTTTRTAGTLYLAQSNTLSLTMPGQGSTTNAGIDVADSPGANSSQNSYVFLGQQNVIYVDGITVGGGRNLGWMGFNTNFASPTAIFRGTNGNSSRVSRWLVGDNSGATATGSNSRGTNDFTAGSIDALVNTMILGRGESPVMSSGNSTGELFFGAGTINVNTLELGAQATGATGGTTTGTGGTNYFGQMDVDGTAMLIVNSNLLMTVTNGGVTGAMSLTAVLNVNGGMVEASNIVGGIGSSTINLNSGAINVQGGQISNITTIAVGNGISSAAQLIDAGTISSPNPINIAVNGTIAGNSTVATPNLIVGGTISPGVNGIGTMTATANTVFNPGGSFAVAVQNANGSSGSGWDFLQVNGQLNLAATNTSPFVIDLQSFDPNGSGEVTNFSADTNYSWTIATANGGITNFSADKFTVATTQFQNDLEGGYFYVSTNNNSLVLCFTNNHPPFAATYALYQTPNGVAIPISTLASNWSDPDGDPVILNEINDTSTNGAAVTFDSNFIYYTNANNVADAIFYSVQDVRTNPPAVYRNGDTQRTATGEIILIPPPPISGATVNGNNFILNGSNGIAGRPFYLLGTTNIAVPLNQWQPLSTNAFDGNGNFNITNSTDPTIPQEFYRLQLQ